MRRFIVVWIILGLASVSYAERPPNILLIVGDDHRTDAYGAYGSEVARTPRLDRLAASGVRFDRAYANSPMCTSSRQSFLTGQYPHAVGVTMLTHALDDEPVTLGERLREAGYRTGAFGKMHFNSDRLHGFEVHRTPRQFWSEHGKRPDDRPLPEGLEVLPQWRPFKDPARIWLNGFYRPTGRYEDEMPGHWYAEEAIAFMREHRDEPFFVQVGFHQPHSPFNFPVEFAGRYEPSRLDVPVPGPEDGGQIPKIFVDLEPEDKQGIIASYLTATAYLDLLVGSLLDAVDTMGLADDTLVIYLGDHGYHLGEHGRFEKHCFYERAVRAPLVMRWPGQIPAGRHTPALVEFVDIVPTVLDYLGVKPQTQGEGLRDLHGHSLRPIVDGKAEAVREAVFSEYQPTEQAMIRTDRHKLIYDTSRDDVEWLGYEPVEPPTGRRVILYDVQADPEEMHNLASDPAAQPIVQELLKQLAGWYHRIPPRGEKPPTDLKDVELLDWAIAPRPSPAG